MSGSIGDNPYRASGVVAAAAAGGGVSWQDVVTASTLTAVAGNGYPINTTSNACTVTLPAAASVGDEIIFTDYARTWETNALTINPNSLNYQGNTTPQPVYDTSGESIHIVYQDATKGWIPTYDGAVILETPQEYTIEWLVIGGGGTGGDYQSGGGGAGGYRNSYASESSGGGGSSESATTLTEGTVYTITVGAGGPATGYPNIQGNDGEDSVLSGSDITDITSIGGGGGGTYHAAPTTKINGRDGGSGGGGAHGDPPTSAGGAGTTDQGYKGGNHAHPYTTPYCGAGGGGASAQGQDQSGSSVGNGGAGLSSSIDTVSTARGGGAGGGGAPSSGAGGTGGGGAGGNPAGTNGTVNTGGGAGGGGSSTSVSGAGGSGVVIIRMDDDDYSGTTTGSPTVITGRGGSSDETILTYTGPGTYTA